MAQPAQPGMAGIQGPPGGPGPQLPKGQPPAGPINPPTREIWLNTPPTFDGNRKKYNNFLQAMLLYTGLNGHIFNTKIGFTLSFLTEKEAAQWREVWVRKRRKLGKQAIDLTQASFARRQEASTPIIAQTKTMIISAEEQREFEDYAKALLAKLTSQIHKWLNAEFDIGKSIYHPKRMRNEGDSVKTCI